MRLVTLPLKLNTIKTKYFLICVFRMFSAKKNRLWSCWISKYVILWNIVITLKSTWNGKYKMKWTFSQTNTNLFRILTCRVSMLRRHWLKSRSYSASTSRTSFCTGRSRMDRAVLFLPLSYPPFSRSLYISRLRSYTSNLFCTCRRYTHVALLLRLLTQQT